MPALDVACPVAITRTRAAATALARHTGAALENLETFAVARACAQARIPFAAVLGISNRVGPQAHREWLRHAAPAAAAACAVVERWLVSATRIQKRSQRDQLEESHDQAGLGRGVPRPGQRAKRRGEGGA